MSGRLFAVFAAVAFLVMSPPLFADTIYFPQVADGGGYVTTFTILNTNSTSVLASLSLFDQNGGPRVLQLNGSTASQFSFTLPAGGTIRLSSSNAGSTTTAGWASLDSTLRLQGVATFDYRSGGLLQTTAGVIGATSLTRAIIPIDRTGSFTNTGVAVANVMPTSIAVHLRLYNESGLEIAGVDDARLNPMVGRKQVAAFIHELFPSAPDPFKGSLAVEVVGAGSIAVTGLTIKEGLLSAIPAIDVSPTPSSGKSLEQVQTEKLIGSWVLTYTVTSQVSDIYHLSEVEPSVVSPAEWVIWGENAAGAPVLGGYIDTAAVFDLYEPGATIDKFFLFVFNGANTVRGCYYEAPAGTTNISSCYSMTGVRTSSTPLSTALVDPEVTAGQDETSVDIGAAISHDTVVEALEKSRLQPHE